jgi:H+/gluconate symporter-like permease
MMNIIVGGVLGLVAMLCCGFIYYRRRRRGNNKVDPEAKDSRTEPGEQQQQNQETQQQRQQHGAPAMGTSMVPPVNQSSTDTAATDCSSNRTQVRTLLIGCYTVVCLFHVYTHESLPPIVAMGC